MDTKTCKACYGWEYSTLKKVFFSRNNFTLFEPIKIPSAANGTINLIVLRSNSFLNLYTAIKSENMSIGRIIAKAWFKGMTTVINGIDIKDIEPPKPDFATPYKRIAGTTHKINR